MKKYFGVLALFVSGCATPSASTDTGREGWRYVNESTADPTMWSSGSSDVSQSTHYRGICYSAPSDRSTYFRALSEHNLAQVEAIVGRWGCHVHDYDQVAGLQVNVAEACRMDEELCRAACRGVQLHRSHLHFHECD
ncbi:hypothetical protein KBD34_03175 [Patescibacteria group bacterium]|nr:hypothetical protein [Patescibacteria group bacterium]